MLHRAVAVLATGLLLHLNVLGIERACGPRHESSAASEHAAHGHQAPAPAPTSTQQSKCCDALSACAMTFQLATESTPDPTGPMVAPVAIPGNAMHDALARAPDPPPPKA